MVKVPVVISYFDRIREVPASGLAEAALSGGRLLPVVDVDADDASTLPELALAAFEQHRMDEDEDDDLEERCAGVMIGLPTPNDDFRDPISRALVVAVSATGEFNWRPATATYGDLRRTFQVGLIDDPNDGITLILSGGWGGWGGVPEWSHLLELVEAGANYLIYAGGLYAGAQFLQEFVSVSAGMLRRGAKAARRVASREPAAMPDVLDAVLRNANHLPAVGLSEGLGLTVMQTTDLLRMFGYAPAGGGSQEFSRATGVETTLAAFVFREAMDSGVERDSDLAAAVRTLNVSIERLIAAMATDEPALAENLDSEATEVGEGEGWVQPR